LPKLTTMHSVPSLIPVGDRNERRLDAIREELEKFGPSSAEYAKAAYAPLPPHVDRLTTLSPEFLYNIFSFVDTLDLARLSQTCTYFSKLIGTSDVLWRTHYLRRFVSQTYSWLDNSRAHRHLPYHVSVEPC